MEDQNKNDSDFFRSLEYFQKTIKNSSSVSSSSYGLIFSILLFTYVGWSIDSIYDMSPMATVIGIFIGIVIGFYHLFKVMRPK